MIKVNTVGIDVSAKTLDVASSNGKHEVSKTFDNTPSGHQKLITSITKNGAFAMVVLEATGSYSLTIALALVAHPRIEVMIANPRAVHNFGKATMQRSKSDPIDAKMILKYCQKMDFIPWVEPPKSYLILRGMTRRVRQLADEITREKNRLHGKGYEDSFADAVVRDIEVNIRHLEKRQAQMLKQAHALVCAESDLLEKYQLLISVKGIAMTSGLLILGELILLPPDMKPPQWVAFAGIDPREYTSGTSVSKKRRITKAGDKYLRAALYMPVLSAVVYEPHIRAFYEKLTVERAKKPIVAQVAVMRKLLHAIWGMFHHNQPFDARKFHPLATEKQIGGQ